MKKLITILAAVALIAAFAMPAPAAEWNFYGSARMTTFSDTVDPGTGTDDTDTTWAVQGNSRIGAKVKAGDVSGAFEYGSGPNLRILTGTWNFGAGSLLAGQTYTPVNIFISNQVWGSDNDMLNFGGVYAGRRAMIQLQFGTFKLALVGPHAQSDLGTGSDVDVTLPKFEVAYKFSTDMFWAQVVAGYQTYSLDAVTVTADDGTTSLSADGDVSSYIAALAFGVNAGPVSFKADVFTGQNLGPYGMYVSGDINPTITGGDTNDNTSLGFLGLVSFKATDALAFEVGYGRVENDIDGSVEKDDTSAYYGQATVTLAPGVFIVPEVGFIDNGKSFAGADQGDHLYFGAKWQINF